MYIFRPAFSFGEFNKTESKDLPPVSLVGDFPIFNQSVDCSSNTKASLAVNVNSNSTAQVKLGVVAAGKLLPFQIDEFAVVTGEYGLRMRTKPKRAYMDRTLDRSVCGFEGHD